MKKLIYLFSLSIMVLNLNSQNLIPKISKKNVSINKIDNRIDIDFDVIDSDNTNLDIQCHIYNIAVDKKYEEVIPQLIDGDIGFPITQGLNKHISIFLDLVSAPSNLVIVLSAYDREAMDVKALISQVSPSKLQEHLLQIQGKRNTADPTFYNVSRNYIVNQSANYIPIKTLQTVSPPYTCINYEATKFGTHNPSNIIILDAHYDCVPVSPGADDNGSGVVGVLEAIRILSEYSFKKSVRFLFFDLEELGLIGSNVYMANQINKRDSVKGVINLEMIGYYSDLPNTQFFPNGFNILFPEAYNTVILNNNRGDFITNVGCTNSGYLKVAFQTNANTFVPELKVISLEVFGTGMALPDLRRSDHAVFWDRNIPAVMITDGANFRNKNYHTAKDSLHYLNFDFMANVVKAAIATMVDWGEIEHGTSIEIPLDLSTTTKNIDGYRFYTLYEQDHFLLKSNSTIKNAVLELFDVSGNLVCKEKSDLQSDILTKIHCPALIPGIYYLTIKYPTGRQTQKVFVHGL